MGIWNGGYIRKPGLGYMEIVPPRDANTLLPIIQAHTAPGTTIHSDQWRAYSNVITLPAVHGHGVVNHSLHFVDPVTGVHTQTVESYWNRRVARLLRDLLERRHRKGRRRSLPLPFYFSFLLVEQVKLPIRCPPESHRQDRPRKITSLQSRREKPRVGLQ